MGDLECSRACLGSNTRLGFFRRHSLGEHLPSRHLLSVGEWPPVSTRQDMGRTIRGGLAHKIKACTALVDVHRKILYSTKYDTFLITLSHPEYIRRGRGPLANRLHQATWSSRSIQYTKDTGRRVLRRSDGPNLSKSLSLCRVSPSGS